MHGDIQGVQALTAASALFCNPARVLAIKNDTVLHAPDCFILVFDQRQNNLPHNAVLIPVVLGKSQLTKQLPSDHLAPDIAFAVPNRVKGPGPVAVTANDLALRVHLGVIALHDPGVVLCGRIHQALDGAGAEAVVRIQEHQVVRIGQLQSPVSGAGKAPVLLVNYRQALETVQNAAGGVRAAVINDDQAEAMLRLLLQHRGDTLTDILLHIIGRNNDVQFCCRPCRRLPAWDVTGTANIRGGLPEQRHGFFRLPTRFPLVFCGVKGRHQPVGSMAQPHFFQYLCNHSQASVP